jgi:iron complex transport system substrate-binding protein
MSYRRIACLSTEAVETIYLLGAEERLAGISGFTVYPPRARKEKPKVSGFSSAKIERILAVEPDLVIGFSDLQAEIMQELVKRGIEVHVYNHRDIEGILRMIRSLGALVDRAGTATMVVADLQERIAQARREAARRARRPKVYFEEWNEPLISGIGWVAEIVALAGGEDCFPELSRHPRAKERIIADPDEVIRRRPDIIVGSWCGKKFVPGQVFARPGWDSIPAVRDGRLYEIKSADILSPGPSAITRGLKRMAEIVAEAP